MLDFVGQLSSFGHCVGLSSIRAQQQVKYTIIVVLSQLNLMPTCLETDDILLRTELPSALQSFPPAVKIQAWRLHY